MSAAGGRGAIVIRPAVPGDAAALAAMGRRCSGETRYRRFHGPVTEIPAAYLRRCLDAGPHAHEAVVAELVTGAVEGRDPRLVGLASAGPVAGAPRSRELGVLVEDDWQRQGIGGAMVAELLDGARRAGVERVRLEMCRARPSLIAYVVARLDVVATGHSGCDVTIDCRIDGAIDNMSDDTSGLAVPATAQPAYESSRGDSSARTVSS